MAEKEYIERERILQHLSDKTKEFGDPNEGTFPFPYSVLLTMKYAQSVVATAPAADVAPVVHARWDEDKYAFCNVCPECGLIIERTCIKRNSGKLNLCPNCGAKMDGERKETTP